MFRRLIGILFLAGCVAGRVPGATPGGQATGASGWGTPSTPAPSLALDEVILAFPWTPPSDLGGGIERDCELELGAVGSPKLLTFSLDDDLPPGMALELEVIESGGRGERRRVTRRPVSILIRSVPESGRVRLRYRFRQEPGVAPGDYPRVIGFTLLDP